MPIRQGFEVSRAVIGTENARLSNALEDYAIDYSNAHPVPVAPASPRWRVRARPAKSNARARSGDKRNTYLDDMYYRFYVTPSEVAFGAVVPPQTRTVNVWNAWLDSRTLNAVVFEPSDEGLSLNVPALPFEFRALREINYDLTVTTDAPSTFSVTITFDFDSGYDPSVLVTGSAAVLLPFHPSWKQSRFNETFMWKTTVETGYAGRESRASLRRWPRLRYQYVTRQRNENAQALDNLLIGWASRMLAVPEWHRAMHMTSPVSAGATVIPVDATGHATLAEGGQVVIWLDPLNYEVAEVLSFTSTAITIVKPLVSAWSVKAKVFATSICAMASSTNTPRVGTTFIDMPVNVDVSPRQTSTRFVDLPAEHTYEGRELYLRKINWRTPMQNSQANNESRFDVDPAFFVVNRRGPYPVNTKTAEFQCRNRDDADALLGFFYRRRGMQIPVWAPTHMDDFTLAAPVSAGVNLFDIKKNAAHVLLGADHPLRRHVLLQMRDGTYFASRIESYTDIGGGLVRLQTADAPPFAVTPAGVKRFSFLGFYRLSSDEVTFAWLTNTVCEVSVAFTALEVPAPEA